MDGTTARAVAALEAATEVSNGLRGDVQDYTKVVRRVYWAIIAGLIVMAVVLVGVGVVVKSSNNVTNVIADCQAPTGKCRQENNKRTAKIQKEIIDEQIKGYIYMGQCARLYPGISGPEYDEKLEACVVKRLAEKRPLGSPR